MLYFVINRIFYGLTDVINPRRMLGEREEKLVSHHSILLNKHKLWLKMDFL